MRLKKKTAGFFLLFLTLGMLVSCGKDEGPIQTDDESRIELVLTSGTDEDEIFRIGPLQCTRDEAVLYLTNMQDRYFRVYGEGIRRRSLEGKSLEDELRQVTLSRLVQVKTMLLMAEDRGVEADEAMRQKAKEAAAFYCDSLPDALKGQAAFSPETVQKCYEEMAVADLVYRQIIAQTHPEISDDEARMVTVSQIFLSTGTRDEKGGFTPYGAAEKQVVYQKALSLLARLQQGEDFDQVAAANNEEERITVSFGKGEREEAVDRAAFELGSEELSDVIETKEGYLILKCLKPFDRQQTDLRKEMIIKRRKEEAFLQTYEEYTTGRIRTFDEKVWNSLTTPDVAASQGGENFFVVFKEFFPDAE